MIFPSNFLRNPTNFKLKPLNHPILLQNKNPNPKCRLITYYYNHSKWNYKLTKSFKRIEYTKHDRELSVPIKASDPSPTPFPMNRRRFRAHGMEEAGGIFLCAASWPSPSLEPLYMAESTRSNSVQLRLSSSKTLKPGARDLRNSLIRWASEKNRMILDFLFPSVMDLS